MMLSRRSGYVLVLIVVVTVLSNQLGAGGQTVLPRRDIRDFLTDSRQLAALKRAVEVMKQRSQENPADPTGWTFQANIHGAGDVSSGIQDGSNLAWNKCQHQQWWFLPWHRAYLYYFERIARKASGDNTLRIPYWNYSDRLSRAIPAPFLDESGPLFVAGRNLTSSSDELSPTAVDPFLAMSRGWFVGSDAQRGFGGGTEATPVSFPFLDKTGSLERVPHNQVHVEVGGLMGHPWTAAQDPLFWLHHCNIDRLWDSWIQGGHSNPDDPSFLDATLPPLFDEDGTQVNPKVRDFIDSKKLGYVYTSILSGDSGGSPVVLAPRQVEPEGSNTEAMKKEPRTLAESKKDEALVVQGDPVTATVDIVRQEPFVRFLARDFVLQPKSQSVLLVLDGIEFDRLPSNRFEVYLNLPTADYTTAGQTGHYVGSVAFFEHPAAAAHDAHAPNRTQTIDITSCISALKAKKDYDPAHFKATIVPVGPFREGKPTRPTVAVPIRIKRVAIVSVQSAGG